MADRVRPGVGGGEVVGGWTGVARTNCSAKGPRCACLRLHHRNSAIAKKVHGQSVESLRRAHYTPS